ncbi:MAG TPA: dihydrofolate reductase family protein [Acidimicrobiales bacterium]|nr:dihydrofolate reductase family protein [Acidimicrobiales bacterium]
MAKLIYGANMTLDGYMEDRDGKFDWSEPDEEVHTFINDLYRSTGTFLFGRRMYETMAVWDTDPELATSNEVMADFAGVYQAADKVVYSTTLDAPWTPRTRLEREFDPDAVRELKNTASRDLAIGGPDLAAHAFRAGLVNELCFFVAPVSVGGGKPALPDFRVDFTLADQHRFPNGWVFLRYEVNSA